MSMTLAEIKTAIGVELMRGDLIEVIAQQIKSTVLAEHMRFDYVGDSQGAHIDFGTSSTIHQLSYNSALTRPRKISSVYLTDVNQLVGPALTPVSASEMHDSLIFESSDLWYVAGDQLVTKTSTASQYVYVRYLRFPDITDVNIATDWMVRDFPYFIIHKVTASILASKLSKLEAAKTANDLAHTHWAGIAALMIGV